MDSEDVLAFRFPLLLNAVPFCKLRAEFCCARHVAEAPEPSNVGASHVRARRARERHSRVISPIQVAPSLIL